MRYRCFVSQKAILFCFVLSLLFMVKAFAAEVPKISKEDLRELLGKPEVIVIDVRLSGDLADSDSKIKGAIHEDPRNVETWMDKYPKDKTLVFYCA